MYFYLQTSNKWFNLHNISSESLSWSLPTGCSVYSLTKSSRLLLYIVVSAWKSATMSLRLHRASNQEADLCCVGTLQFFHITIHEYENISHALHAWQGFLFPFDTLLYCPPVVSINIKYLKYHNLLE